MPNIGGAELPVDASNHVVERRAPAPAVVDRGELPAAVLPELLVHGAAGCAVAHALALHHRPAAWQRVHRVAHSWLTTLAEAVHHLVFVVVRHGRRRGEHGDDDEEQKAKQTALDVRNILLPSTSDVLYGLVDGSIVSTTWNQLTGSTDRLASYVLKKVGNNVGGVAGNIIDYFASGANYVCYVNGKQVTYTTSVKYPVIAGGVAIGKSADGKKSQRDGPAFPGGGG